MSPRPRKVSDDELFAATHAVMNRVGPGELTLAAIAREAGVTAAVLVQRFGSKRDLLLTLAERFADGSGDLLGDLIKRHRSPLAALRAYADCMAGMAASPAALARNLSYLQIDLTDPRFPSAPRETCAGDAGGTQRTARCGRKERRACAGVKPAQLARTIEAVIGGSMLSWGFYQEGSAAQWIRADVEAVLAPYLAATRHRGKRTRAARRR